MATGNAKYFLKSLAKGMHVIQIMAESREALNLAELSRRAGTNNASVTRICHTLTELGFVRRDHQRRFHLTPKMLSLGYTAMSSLGWRQVAKHYLEQLARQTGETVNLSVLQGSELVYLVRINNTGRILPFDLQIGSRLPLHCTSMGKVLLAFAHPEERERILSGYDFTPLTHRTITNAETFRNELARIHRTGYAVNNEELSVGLRSIAAPVKKQGGQALAALNIAVPTSRMALQEMERRLVPLAMEAAARIEAALGSMDCLE